MKRLIAAAALLAPLAQAELAGASCPGGGGGGAAGAAGGGGAAAAHHAPACEDASDVVGFRRCVGFGAWGTRLGAPLLVFEGGLVMRQFASLLDRQTGSVAHGNESFSYRVLGTTRGRDRDTAALAVMRAGVGLPYGAYTALEVDLGGIVRPARAATEMTSTGVFGSPALAQDHGSIIDALATVGVRGRARVGSLGAELSGGVRAVTYGFDSRYHDCAQTTTITAYAAVAEARLRGELWLAPWITAGATAGTSVIERAAWMAGLYVGVHTRAFQ